MKNEIKWSVLTLCLSSIIWSCQSSTINKTAVAQLDLKRYMGKWYEIARIDHWYERGLEGCQANYSLDGNHVKVINSGFKNSLTGLYKEAVGKAKNTDEPGKLKVAFFLNFYAEYNVLELGENYQYALIGGKNDDYLWILSRTPQMEKVDLDYLLNRAIARGYDINKLKWVEQPKP